VGGGSRRRWWREIAGEGLVAAVLFRRWCLYQAAHAEVFLNDDVVDGGHDEADLHCIGGAGEMGVDLLGGMLVEAVVVLLACFLETMSSSRNLRNKSVQDVVARGTVILTTLVVGEVVLHRRDRELLLETIDLVQEENYAGLCEPSAIAN
jgi:hypothetical protein